MGQSFDILLTAAALIVGILLLTGHGDFFLKGGNAELVIMIGLGLYLKFKCVKKK